MNSIKYSVLDKDLYIPNTKYSIDQIMPTSLKAIDLECERKSLEGSYSSILYENGFFNVNHVVIIIIDSLGLNQIANSKFGDLFNAVNGLELSSVFPTVTSAAVSSIMLGLPPSMHGILGHKIYVPELDNIIDLLKMSPLNETNSIFDKIAPSDLIWNESISKLQEDLLLIDIAERSIAGHGLSNIFQNLKHTFGYYGFSDGLAMTKYFLTNYNEQKSIITLYNGVLDHIAHGYGPFSPEFKDSMHVVLYLLKQFLNRLPEQILRNTSFVITADHGQTRLTKQIEIKAKEAEKILPYLSRMPGRSGRVIHFYVPDENLEIVYDWLNKTYGEHALILSFNDCLKYNLLFCDECEKLRKRIGDILVILRDNVVSVFERESEENTLFSRRILGSHGSLSLNELRVPFIASNGYILLRNINNLGI